MSTLKLVVTIAIILLVGLGFLIFGAASNQSNFIESAKKDIVGCEIIGDALEYKARNHPIMQTIYKCPDGTLKIR